MGITTCVSGVRLEIAMSQHEKQNIEEILLRWRGVRKVDVELVKSHGMRLQRMKYASKAELAPMRGLRPGGAKAEEGREDVAKPAGKQAEKRARKASRQVGRRRRKSRGAAGRRTELQLQLCGRLRGYYQVRPEARKIDVRPVAESEMRRLRKAGEDRVRPMPAMWKKAERV